MDHLFRVMFYGALALFLCVVALLPLHAYAYGLVPKETAVTYWARTPSNTNPKTIGPFGSPGEACTASANEATAPTKYGVVSGASPSFTCTVWTQNPGYPLAVYYAFPIHRETVLRCPANSLLVAGQCICEAEFKPTADGNACEANDCDALVKSLAGQRVYFTGKVNTACLGGCQIRGAVWGYNSATNESFLDGPFGHSGKCEGTGGTGADPGAEPDPSPSCPAGQCRGTVNGTPVCVPCTSVGAEGPSTGASGAGTGTGGSGSGGDGSGTPTSTETSTECSGGRCTTTTIIKDPEGNPIGEETTEETQASFCEDNPEVSFCKETAFSGACASGFQCEGDGVQCAIARQQHLRACQFFEPTGEAVDVGNEAANDQPRSGDHPGLSPQTFSMIGRIDSSNPLAGGCPADYGLNVMGQAIVIPFGSLCGPLQMAGQLVVAVAMLAAMMIVFRRT